jgi:hypothetical protein
MSKETIFEVYWICNPTLVSGFWGNIYKEVIIHSGVSRRAEALPEADHSSARGSLGR